MTQRVTNQNANGRRATSPELLIATDRQLVPRRAFPASGLSSGLVALVEQEVRRRKLEGVSQRVLQLCQTFGFEWEKFGERGHMRLQPPAAFMFRQSYNHAGNIARQVAEDLGAPFLWIDGISVVNTQSKLMTRYSRLLANEPEIYGIKPYVVSSKPPAKLRLRQTGCLQKFAICRDWSLGAEHLPFSLFEISQSFRWEPTDTLQLCARLRRFNLPEAHIHTASLNDAVKLTRSLHKQMAREARKLADDVQVFVSVSGNFVAEHSQYLKDLAASVGQPILIKAYPPGSLCQDGVELDVEYKIIDSLGCPREFSTFQIDTQITRAFGLQSRACGGVTGLTTIHLVCTSSIERNIFFQLDRIAAHESRGDSAVLPSWLAPVLVRVLAERAEVESAKRIVKQFEDHGIRADIDDRAIPLAHKREDAKREVLPYQAVCREHWAADQVLIREHGSEFDQELTVGDIIRRLSSKSGEKGVAPLGRQLSHRPVRRTATRL